MPTSRVPRPPPDPGRARSLAELYDRHARDAYGLALRITHDRRLAESVVEDAFLGVWHDASAEPPADAAARIRDLVRRRALALVGQQWLSMPSELDPGDGPSTEGRAAAVALARLSPPERRLLELADFEGATVHALAGILGLDEHTVCVQLAEALRSFRTLLREQEAADRQPSASSL